MDHAVLLMVLFESYSIAIHLHLLYGASLYTGQKLIAVRLSVTNVRPRRSDLDTFIQDRLTSGDDKTN